MNITRGFNISFSLSRLNSATKTDSVSDLQELLENHSHALKNIDCVKITYRHAVSKDNIETIRLLDEYGLGYRHTESMVEFGTYLLHALKCQSPKVLNYLISQVDGKIVENIFKGNIIISPLHVIIDQIYVYVSRNQILCLQELLRFDRIQKDILHRGRDQTPLMTAASKRATQVLEVLCKGGCQIDMTNRRGFDAAYYCLQPCLGDPKDSARCLQVLIQHGYPLTNRRVITWTINSGNVFALSVLACVNMNLDTDIPEHDDHSKQDLISPLSLAVAKHLDDVVLFLIKAGCKHHCLINEIPQRSKKYVKPDTKIISKEILESYVMVPRSLRDLSRIVVRKSLGLYPRTKILELKLPRLLANYIYGVDFLAYQETGTQDF